MISHSIINTYGKIIFENSKIKPIEVNHDDAIEISDSENVLSFFIVAIAITWSPSSACLKPINIPKKMADESVRLFSIFIIAFVISHFNSIFKYNRDKDLWI